MSPAGEANLCSVAAQFHSCPSGMELEKVMNGADHRPFASDLIETAEEELSEASGAFHLSEDRLDHLFA
jgi:hypothetical protein